MEVFDTLEDSVVEVWLDVVSAVNIEVANVGEMEGALILGRGREGLKATLRSSICLAHSSSSWPSACLKARSSASRLSRLTSPAAMSRLRAEV